MPLNKQKGNMYGFITHTWNTVKGKCYHDCSYCYMKRFPQSETHLDEKEFKTDLGEDNYIFVGSSNDMFADLVDVDFILRTLEHCRKFPNNKYLFQTKNPLRFEDFNINHFPKNTVLCVTLETNRSMLDFMGNCYSPYSRMVAFMLLPVSSKIPKHITIEPIMDFDLIEFVNMIKNIEPEQVNIGADSGNNNLLEPSKDKTMKLITALKKFTKVHLKKNLKRIIGVDEYENNIS